MANENLDYYGLCEEALIERVKTLTEFFPKDSQVSDDDTVVNRGAEYFAIFTPDAFPNTISDARETLFTWQILMDIYVRFTTQAEAKSRLKTMRSSIINLIYPSCLNHVNGVYRTTISANGGVFQDAPERPNFIWQTITVTVFQKVRYSIP